MLHFHLIIALIGQMTQVMDQFERQFENMDVQSEYMEKSINQTTALTTPQVQYIHGFSEE